MSLAVALVSARAAHGLDEDMPPLLAALAAAGAAAQIVDWDDSAVDWAQFDVALLRSTWDYTERLSQFLAWVARAAALTRLQNPASVVRWNCDKHYLLGLEAAAVPVVASSFAEPGEEPAQVLAQFLARHECAELVVKPAVGAGSRDTRRHARTSTQQIVTHMQGLLTAGRSVLLQPYLAAVDRDGETALIYLGGHFSHAIRKGPLLPPDAPASAGLFAREDIRPRIPAEDELAVGAQVLAQLPFRELLYARIDLIRDNRGAPCLLELELTEPSLFFAHAEGSAERLVAAVLGTTKGSVQVM